MTNKEKKPLVGILAGQHKEKRFSGDHDFYQSIDKALKMKGGQAYVFTIADVENNIISGYTNESGKWQKNKFPYPDIVYNRLPTFRQEKLKRAKQFFNMLSNRQIPYFNDSFFDKWDSYQLLRQSTQLQPFLLETVRVNDEEKAKFFLQKHGIVYAKPITGSTGEGIFVLTLLPNGSILMRTHQRTYTLHKAEFETLLTNLKGKSKPYLLQKGITLQNQRGKSFDFRILMQKPDNVWQMTGIGVRQAKKNGITTHVPKGGTILSLTDLPVAVNRNLLNQLGTLAANAIDEKYRNIRECSLDIGLDTKGNYWVFEINSKPMSFDERDIEARRITTLVDTFIRQTNPKSNTSTLSDQSSY